MKMDIFEAFQRNASGDLVSDGAGRFKFNPNTLRIEDRRDDFAVFLIADFEDRKIAEKLVLRLAQFVGGQKPTAVNVEKRTVAIKSDALFELLGLREALLLE